MKNPNNETCSMYSEPEYLINKETRKQTRIDSNRISLDHLLLSPSGVGSGNNENKERAEFAEFCIAQVKQFLYILYGALIRFYSTVVSHDFLNAMKEDLIERITTKLFDNEKFSNLIL